MWNLNFIAIVRGVIVLLALGLLQLWWAGPSFCQDEESSSEHTPFEALPPDYRKLFVIEDTKTLSGNLAFSAKIKGYYRLFTLDFDSKRIRKLVDGPGNNSYPSFSPDGELIAFTSDRDGNNEIYLSRWDGQKQRRMTRNSIGDDNASWSPDGHSLVYYSETGPAGNASSEANLFTLKIKDASPQQLTKFKKRNTTPRWSPDGSTIAYSTNRFWPGWDLCLWKVTSRSEECILTGALSYCRPSFHPSGKTLAYSAGAFSDVDVAQVTIGTKSISNLTELPGRDYDVAWSPDGSIVAFTAENGRKDIFNVFLVKPGSEPTPLITTDHSIRYLGWTGAKTFDLEAKRIQEESE